MPLRRSPDCATNCAIFLKHPPDRERVNFLWVQANATRLSVAISNAQAQVQSSASSFANARAEVQSLTPHGYFLTGDLATTVADLNDVINEDFKYFKASQRTLADLQGTKQAMNAFMVQFDCEPFYNPDFFALSIGFTNRVLPVFDLCELQKLSPAASVKCI